MAFLHYISILHYIKVLSVHFDLVVTFIQNQHVNLLVPACRIAHTQLTHVHSSCAGSLAVRHHHVYTCTYAGWGLDWLWPFLLGYPSEKVAIIDEVLSHCCAS